MCVVLARSAHGNAAGRPRSRAGRSNKGSLSFRTYRKLAGGDRVAVGEQVVHVLICQCLRLVALGPVANQVAVVEGCPIAGDWVAFDVLAWAGRGWGCGGHGGRAVRYNAFGHVG